MLPHWRQWWRRTMIPNWVEQMLDSSRTGAPKRVCLRCWAPEPPRAAAEEPRGRAAPSAQQVMAARLPEVSTEEAVASLADFTFDGPWEFNMLFLQVDLGPAGGQAASSAAVALQSGGFGNKAGLRGGGAARPADKSVREGDKRLLRMDLKPKGAAYFQGEVTSEFALFGAEGKVTGALQRGTGKVSTTIQMVSKQGANAVTTSFNLVGVLNRDGMYSGTFSACEISRSAGSCSGLFKAKAAEALAAAAGGGSSGEEEPSGAGGGGGGGGRGGRCARKGRAQGGKARRERETGGGGGCRGGGGRRGGRGGRGGGGAKGGAKGGKSGAQSRRGGRGRRRGRVRAVAGTTHT